MEQTITITSKWQIHIPVKTRKVLKMEKPGKVLVKTHKGKLIITPIKSPLLSLGGSLNHLYKKRPINIDRIRDIIDYSRI